MAELKNNFSWSFSAAEDFDTCRRRRYWSKYGKWGGWAHDASPEKRKAYQLDKMDNRYSLQGNAVETAVMWALREKQQGRDVTADQAYEQAARPFLNGAYQQSKSGAWDENPKKNCCLHEHYYAALHGNADDSWTATIMDNTKRCIVNFIDRVLPRLANITPDQEVRVVRPGDGGDPEHFVFEGVKIYAIPDYVYREGDTFHIIDWKSGKAKPAHHAQLALYGFWATVKHAVPAEKITVYIEYLADGTTAAETLTEDRLVDVRNTIGESVGDMAEYLVDADGARNEALPIDEWDLAPTRDPCQRCNFYELCAPAFNE